MQIARTLLFPAALGVVMMLVLGACGPKLVRGQAPYVNIRVMDATEETLSLRLRVQNINGVSIELTRVRFTIDLGDESLGRFDGPRQTAIIANGSETLRFELEATDPGRALLTSLEQREIPNLEYRIEGELDTVDEGTLSFSGSGRIYPVPGRPGQFR